MIAAGSEDPFFQLPVAKCDGSMVNDFDVRVLPQLVRWRKEELRAEAAAAAAATAAALD